MGLIMRTTTFRDLGRTIPMEILELFKNRKDNLYRRLRVPLTCSIQESFAPGRNSGIKDLLSILGRRRLMTFYLTARLDGLLTREETTGKGVVEIFSGRDDYLKRRYVFILPPYFSRLFQLFQLFRLFFFLCLLCCTMCTGMSLIETCFFFSLVQQRSSGGSACETAGSVRQDDIALR